MSENLSGFAGDIGCVTLWPFAMSPSRALASYRQQNNLAQWVGLSGENNASDTNQAPAAVPVQVELTAGQASTIDVIARAFDSDGDALSIAAGSLTPTTGSASIVSDRVSWTPASSFEGEATCGFNLRDGGGKSSSSKVYATVKKAVTPNPPELPNPLRTPLIVSNSSELTGALNGTSSLGALQPGDQIQLTGAGPQNQTTYGGNFTLSRNGTAPTNANRNGVPIVITAQNVLGARMTGSFNLNGTNVWLRGIDFDGQNTNSLGVSMNAPHARLLRSRVRRFRTPAGAKAGQIIVSYGHRFQKIWYCEFMDWDGRCISGKTNDLDGNPPKFPHIAYCHAHDNALPPAQPNDYGTGREFIQLGQTQGGTGADCRVNLGGLVEFVRIERSYLPAGGDTKDGTYHDENEPISVKATGNILRYVTFGSSMGGLLNNRFGNSNEYSSCYFASGIGIGVYGDDNLILYNRLLNGARIQILAGTQWMDLGTSGENADAQAAMGIVDGVQMRVWIQPQANPTARRAIIAGNNGLLRIGHVAGTTAGKPVYQTKNNVVRGHTGTIQTQASYGFSTTVAALREKDTTNPSGVPGDLARPLGTEVTAAMVGPLAPWIPPAVWPPTL